MTDKTPSSPDYWEQAKTELTNKDAVMGSIIALYPSQQLVCYHKPFYSLCRSIVGQQISVKAADAVWSRFEDSLDTVEPIHVLGKSPDDLRSLGLSKQKSSYLHNIANFFKEHHLDYNTLQSMNDDEVHNLLIQIKGVGKWTVEMFLIFALLRPNVFPIADIGVQKAIQKHYETDDYESLQQLWSPWNSVATWYLWRSLDPVPVQY